MATLKIVPLSEMPLRETTWIVEGMIQTGLTIVGAKADEKRPSFILQLLHAVAAGTPAFGQKRTLQGEVLYLSLEDAGARVKERSLRITHDDRNFFVAKN